ncbi:MAG: hypothetical protein ACK515_21550 [bacterium]|jgi:hypothetical protein|nr:hypothetical protein [Betaproteobacteria bacterium]
MDRRSLTIALGAVLLHGPALAHTSAELANRRGPNGGQMRATPALHLELVARADELVLHVYDHDDRPVSTKGATGRATVLLGAERSEVRLEPFGANGLRATGRFAPDPKLRVAVTLTLADGKPQQERFEPFRPLPAKK